MVLGEVLKEAEVLQVGSDSDGRDRNVLLVEIGHQLVMVMILAIGVAVGKQDHLMHRDTAAEYLALGDFQRFLEVGAATGFQPLDSAGSARRGLRPLGANGKARRVPSRMR